MNNIRKTCKTKQMSKNKTRKNIKQNSKNKNKKFTKTRTINRRSEKRKRLQTIKKANTKEATFKLLGSREKALATNESSDKKIALVTFNQIQKEIDDSSKKTNEEIKRDFIKSFQTPYTKTKFRPNNNFYDYVTNEWSKTFSTGIQNQANSKYDNFTLIQNNVYYQLYDIFDKFTKNNNSFFARNMKKFQKSAMIFNPVDDSLRYAKEVTAYIDNLRKDKTNLMKYCAYVNKFRFVAYYNFFYFKMAPDEMDPTTMRVHLFHEKFAAMDKVLFEGDERNPKIKRMLDEKLSFYDKVFTLICGKNHGLSARDTYEAYKETYIIYKETQSSNGYYKIHKDEALAKYGFDWEQFATELGFAKAPEFFITGNIECLSKLIKMLLEKWTTEKWRPLILMKLYRFIVRFNREGRKIYQEYYGKFLQGIEGNIFIDNKNVTIIYLVYPYANFLSREYHKRFFNENAVAFVKQLANDLKSAFLKILRRNSWMSEKTKKAAIDKIEKLEFKIGEKDNKYEDEMLPDCTHMEFHEDRLMENMIKISHEHVKSYIKMEGKRSFDLYSIDWTKFPFTITGNKSFIVNAYYAFRSNTINVSLALLQPPFVDLNNMGLQYNLATIGFVIAHEMSHALDSVGGRFDANGKLNRVGKTEEDIRKYEAIQADILKQYKDFAARDGIKFNADLSLPEDLADISGLAICEEYLRDYMMTTNEIASVKYLNFRIFYNYFAYNLRQFIPKSALEKQLLINPHPPDVYRVNVPLSRSVAFRASFNVKKGDGMWWHNTNTIW
jgi:putative endopeptidase